MKQFKVKNRSDGNITYALPEMNKRRVFAPNEVKDIGLKELDALFQGDGGAGLIKQYLMVQDKEWVEKNFDPPIEYFWDIEEITKCMLEDSLDLFTETLEYAPAGVIDIIKKLSWQIPLTDLNKISAIRTKLGFDVQAAMSIMESRLQRPAAPKGERKRRREA